MRHTHFAKPVRVFAYRIVEVKDVTDRSDGRCQSSPDLELHLESGFKFDANASMTARYVPVVGDYVVTQDDEYSYINPKDVFERKYSAFGPAPDYQQRVRDEKKELDGKLAALLTFFQDPIFEALPEAERSRLRNQARFMDGYAAVLGERIAAFTPVVP